MLKINDRISLCDGPYHINDRNFVYPEYVFGEDEGGGQTFALGLIRAGKVCALVYLPPAGSNMDRARKMARLRLMADVPEVRTVKFTPFNGAKGGK